jgi:hypothetical protein
MDEAGAVHAGDYTTTQNERCRDVDGSKAGGGKWWAKYVAGNLLLAGAFLLQVFQN